MLRTTVELHNYRFVYEYGQFTVYSNTENIAPKLSQSPILTNAFDDPILYELIHNEKILQLICGGQKVLAIALVGSRSLDTADQWSDYDLLVITDDVDTYIDHKPDCYITYNNEFGIHWYQYSKNLLFDVGRQKAILEFGCFWQLTMKRFIAIWDADFIVTLNKSISDSLNTECMAFYNSVYKSTIDQVLEGKALPKTKLLYHLCVASHFLEKTDLNREFLIELKRIHYMEISEKCKNYCIERIRLLKQFAEANSGNL